MTNDQSRPVATRPDNDFTLSIDDALERYSHAGYPRTPRSVQRYCAKGHLEGRLVDTGFGYKWLITPDSVDKHIAYIQEVTTSTGRDASRQVATSRTNTADGNVAHAEGATSIDQSRPVATGPDMSRYIERVEGENEFLRQQITVKDAQIKDLTERARETNHLIAGLQKMLSPLLSSPASPPQGDN